MGKISRIVMTACVSFKDIMAGAKHFETWENAVIWLRGQPDQRQLVLDAFYDDPLIAAAKRYFDSHEWQ